MILIDANILLYAEDSQSPHHSKARQWWDAQLSGSSTICLCWTVINAFIRIGTNPRVFRHPLSIDRASRRVQDWLDQPPTRVIVPSEQHWSLLRELLIDGKATANFVTDAHLAALAIAHGCELQSTDSDFSRFRKLKWKNPLI